MDAEMRRKARPFRTDLVGAMEQQMCFPVVGTPSRHRYRYTTLSYIFGAGEQVVHAPRLLMLVAKSTPRLLVHRSIGLQRANRSFVVLGQPDAPASS
jgi:hypothetical protein